MTQHSAAPAVSYRADIDGLRCLAVLLVLVFHFDLFSLGEAGFIGVDVFFVISGFLITSILKRHMDAGRFSFRGFYLARIRRLAPALLAVLLLVLIGGWFLLFAADFEELSRQTIVSQLYVANIYFWRHVNYFGLGKENVFLLHTWSLAVEEQFYLFYPVALWLVHKYQRRYFWHWIAAGLVASFLLNIAFVGRKPEATFYLFPTRAWELLVGGLVPWIVTRWPRLRAAHQVLGTLAMGCVAAAVLCYRKDVQFPGFFALLPVAGATLLLISGDGGKAWTTKLLSLRPIVYVGKISYPLYLVHWPVNVFASRWMHDGYGIGWRYAMFSLSILLASAVYHLVENPVRHGRWFGPNRRMLRGYGVGLAATVALAVAVQWGSGLPQRFPAEASLLAAYVNDRSPPLTECEFSRKLARRDEDICRIGIDGGKPTWMVYGDSHAWAAHDAFDKWLRLKGETGLFIYRQGCPPLMDVHLFHDKGECHAFNEAVAAFLGRNRGVVNVALVSTWRQAPEAALSTSESVLLSKEASLDLFDRSFSQTLVRLHDLGKRTYVWEPVPGAARSVPYALARAALDRNPPDIEFTREQYAADNEFFFSALARNRRLIVASFSPAEALCASGGRCAVTIDGRPAYFDNAHITRSPTDFWVRVLQRAEEKANADAAMASARMESASSWLPAASKIK